MQVFESDIVSTLETHLNRALCMSEPYHNSKCLLAIDVLLFSFHHPCTQLSFKQSRLGGSFPSSLDRGSKTVTLHIRYCMQVPRRNRARKHRTRTITFSKCPEPKSPESFSLDLPLAFATTEFPSTIDSHLFKHP